MALPADIGCLDYRGEISLRDVITAMEGRKDLSECRSCIKEKQEFRLLRHVYEELEIGKTRQLQAVTICELLPKNREKKTTSGKVRWLIFPDVVCMRSLFHKMNE